MTTLTERQVVVLTGLIDAEIDRIEAGRWANVSQCAECRRMESGVRGERIAELGDLSEAIGRVE
jgi:hypothetical protein